MHQTNYAFMYAALITVSFLWGTSFAAAKIGMYELEPLNLVIFRFLIASAVFGVVLLQTGTYRLLRRQDIPRFIVLGFLAITSYFYIQYTGLRYTTTINAALIVATSPIWTVLFSTMLGWDNITPLGLAGIVIAFTGVSVIITNGQWINLFNSSTITGDILLLINAVVWAGFTVYGKTILQKYRPFVAMAYIHIFGTLMLLPFAFVPSPFAPSPLYRHIGDLSWPTVMAALYLALLCSVYAYYIWYTGVEMLGAVRTVVFTYLNPLFAIIAGTWLLGEKPTVSTFAGGIMVVTGVYLTNRKPSATSTRLKTTPENQV